MNLDKKESWIIDAINMVVKLGGELIEEDHYQERLKICQECDHFEEVPISDLSKQTLMGCGICKCPAATKPRYKKYFSFSKMRIIEAKCPDQVNRWAEVDNQFFNLKNSTHEF